jgi:hypothetical protein
VDVQDDGPAVDNDGLADVIRDYNLWRRIANSVGSGPYDEADWDDDRLYFRSDYSEKLREWPDWAQNGYWGAWIIAPTREGYFCVMRSLLHERAAQRSESIEAIFSHSADAGKYIVLQVGDSARYRLGLETLFMKWDARGFSSRIRIEPASREAVAFWNRESPTLKQGFAEKHLKSYTLEDDPSSYGFALPSEHVNMEVLALSFEELTEALLDGMPESITSEVSLWRQ